MSKGKPEGPRRQSEGISRLSFEDACEELLSTFRDYVESDGEEAIVYWWTRVTGQRAEWIAGEGDEEGYLIVHEEEV
jgi:hypothetical protein